ncbi:MAG TPA: UDP-N-acetylglucosamine 4,6-dehydratase (inverting) [Nitrospinaceae bacterium]|nr:UDP-N-acetylglucosamine 4,6-dehydratase (inverting) [Nitrospinaceae bacterium]
MLDNKNILVTGGTGSFGKKLIATIFEKYKPKQVIVFSRDELKQFEMRDTFPTEKFPIKYYIGDIRDRERLYRVSYGMDLIVHAAAMKQVPTAEYNPFEAVKTNINGAQNVIEAALENGVKRVVALSTDKACSPINLYGATKLTSDKLFAAANHWQGSHQVAFSVVRYGNVVGSRGSVIPFFIKKKAEGVLPITHESMTRFWITLEQGVEFVLYCLKQMHGGELFVPKIPSMNIMDLAKAIAPEAKTEIIGIRPGEKIHEVMISSDDALNTLEFESHYVIQPAHPWWDNLKYIKIKGGKAVENDFVYSSDNNSDWLTVDRLKQYIAEL